jgi:hypothetical protein
LYIVDGFNYRVRKGNTSGIISTFAGTGSITSLGTGDGYAATAATFDFLVGVVADDTGNIYISDEGAGKIRKVNTTGVISTFAGNGSITYVGDGMAATSAQMAPEWMVFDSSGNLVVSDRSNERIYKIDRGGIFHCIAGIGGTGTFGGDGGPATAASLDPGGVCFDPCWNLYVPDIDNNRVRKIDYNPTCNLSSLALSPFPSRNLEMSIYPNPVYDELTITCNTNIREVTISNMLGQMVHSQEYAVEKAVVDVSHLSVGVYLLRVVDCEGRVVVQKFVKSGP